MYTSDLPYYSDFLYDKKSAFFLTGKREAFVSLQKENAFTETLIFSGFCFRYIILAYMLIGFGGWQHWLGSKNYISTGLNLVGIYLDLKKKIKQW